MILRRPVAAVALLLGALACAQTDIRTATYPRSFHYITQEEIRTTMGELARNMDALDQTVQDGISDAERARVELLLTEMRRLAGQLKKGERSNHPRIDSFAPRLVDRIEWALEDARREPPNYYYALTMPSACTFCHESRRTAAQGRPQ
jgi:hypothetical protein